MRVLMTALLVVSLSGSLFAASPHYKHDGQPVCVPASADTTGTSFNGACSAGEVAGLGNEDLTFGVVATANAGTFCHNPGNSNIVPGQNPAEAQFASLATIPGSAIKNGTATLPAISFAFSVGTPTSEQAGCPNDGWTVTLGPVVWSAQYVVYQPFPNLLSDLSFAF